MNCQYKRRPAKSKRFNLSVFPAELPLDHVVGDRAALGQRHNVSGDRLHHALVLLGVVMPIVNRTNATLDVVLDAVHGRDAEAEPGNCRSVCPNVRNKVTMLILTAFVALVYSF